MNLIVRLSILTANIRAFPASVQSLKSDDLHLVADAHTCIWSYESRGNAGKQSLDILHSSLPMCACCPHSVPLGSWEGGRSGR